MRCGVSQHFEERVWVKVIKLIAPLDPKPVAKCDTSAESQCGKESNGVWRGEEEQIDYKHD